jgi:aspartyl protease family protein
MDGDQIARLAYLGLLAAALGGWFFMQLRGNLSRTLQQLAIWALIFVGVIAGYGLWNDIRRDVMPVQAVLQDGRIEVPRGPDGHYHLTVEVNGVPVAFVVDTGATDLVLSQADARAVGIDPDSLSYLGTAQTANGSVAIAQVRLDVVRLGGIEDRNLRAVVNGGELDGSLLGMGYLGLFAHIEIVDDRLILTR